VDSFANPNLRYTVRASRRVSSPRACRKDSLPAENKIPIRWSLSAVLACAAMLLSCGTASNSGGNVPPPPSAAPLTQSDVQSIVGAVAQTAAQPMVIAVTDRTGAILGIFATQPTAPLTGIGNFGDVVDARELAVALARTAGLFSNDQAPLSSRTVR